MEIINKELVDNFIARHADSGKAINRWIAQMEEATFKTHNELKLIFPNADYIGNSRYVFNIKGNDYRLVALILYAAGLITVCFIGTHAEYDKIDCLTVLQ
jgi:mRNA interferase HigB